MMKTIKPVLLFLVLSLLPAGCVTHTFLIDFTSGSDVRYKVEGDEIDIVDGRIACPDSTLWMEIDREETVSDDGNRSIKIAYKSRNKSVLNHPVGPKENPGIIKSNKSSNFFIESTHFEITFPSWQVLTLYGDPEMFVADETRILDEEGAEELLPPDEYRRLENLRLQGLAKGTAQRYLKQVARIVEAVYLQQDMPLDSLALKDAIERFSAVLSVQLLTLKNMDAEDVTLEWYNELRTPMATSISEATGADFDWCLEYADLLDNRYKSWLDMKDDNVEVNVILPAMFTFAKADTSMGDTLVWSLNADNVSNNDVIISADGYTLKAGSYFIIVIFILLPIVIAVRMKK